jgi:hypothetical protein
MGVSAAVVAGGSLLSGYLGSQASANAADAMQQSAAMQAQVQRDIYNQTREDYAPWRQAGVSALGDLQSMLDPNYDFTASPDYQWRFGQGVNALDKSAAAQGNLLSGRQLKAVTDFGQNIGAQEYNNRFNRLASLAGIGQSGVAGSAQAGQNYATGASNAYGNMGQARASGYLGQANAWGNAMNQGMGMYGASQGWFG